MAGLLMSKARPVLFARVLTRRYSYEMLRFPYDRYMASLSRLLKPSQLHQRLVRFIAVDSQNHEYEVYFHRATHGFYLSGSGWSELCNKNGIGQHDVILIFMYKHNVVEGAPITAEHRLLIVKETGHEMLDGNFCCDKCGTTLLAASRV